ncbi:hypothetical protein K7X08_010669 [Anisodus acutangulus]|uniref:Beta-fructofuranosidase n=1 Tax=Anisodus acutangulus TaxID=402998 RepID=A0A9Q1R820_9SOLA|nr:hypothetical protein K7X08_010669 [Anisodus acutangulus]
MPDSLPEWVFDFVPSRGGYFIGDVSPAHMDFCWFCLGNCIAILSSLATPEQTSAIMDLIESRWQELVGEMLLKICYPAMEAAIRTGRPHELVVSRLLKDSWLPEKGLK